MKTTLIAVAQGIAILAFAGYGTSALLSRRMVDEFERYGVARLRVLTGALQVLGSVGLLVGYFYRPLLLLSATGFAVMMLLGVIVRIRIRDPFPALTPALVLICLNALLVILEWQRYVE